MGALTAELATRCAPERYRPRRAWPLFVAAIVASNAPDLDFVYTFITPGKLGSLLHHRGHTHTLPIAVAIGALVAVGANAWARRRARRASEPHGGVERAWIWGLCAFGVLSHLLMDFTNSYGVHPFWPWQNQWYFGDAVFIVEPFLWVALAGTLALACQHRLTRYANAAIVVLALLFVWLLPVPLTGALLVSSLAVAVWFARRALPRAETRALACCGLLLGFYTWSFAAREAVGRVVREALLAEPSFEVFDMLRSPTPATPWCWDVMLIGKQPGQPDAYVTRTGKVSLAPFLAAPEACPNRRAAATVELDPLGVSHPGLFWEAELRVPLEHFERALENCTFRAFLRFARVPFYLEAERIAGDLRFDFDEDLSFAEFVLPDGTACPPWVPPWVPPRSELLERSAPRR